MDPRSVIITGAGAGIGRGIAQAFADAGDLVYLADISGGRLADTVGEIKGGERVHTRELDVTDFEAVRQLVSEVTAATGRLDVFVNNAGVFDGYASVSETTPALWNKIIGVNLTGYFHGLKAAAAPMAAAGKGRIINIGSVAGQRGAADGLAYAASKAGIEGMTRRAAFDLARAGVTVNVVAPGVIKTDIRANSEEILGGLIDTNRGVGATPEMMDFLIPAGRAGGPDEIAGLVLFLACDAAAYLTGQVIQVDGGWNAV
ncbi:SDR family NAD(P)-dependent oxidoreductase [Streptomyces sp. GMR22]|uniref:SDR family NAD(P)-dependent oxidoreductase n=1 Tax=Streptomyces sp. GMR22 TaxID=2759524 RepID=UPI0015FB7CB3|nr:SDR family NAD(P)-dependent oxidoreductase [Streptomyces sp. GMR22]MBA6440769.1 SDR family oxidoreductase [Streptomyces sp. GMR22]